MTLFSNAVMYIFFYFSRCRTGKPENMAQRNQIYLIFIVHFALEEDSNKARLPCVQ